MRLSAKEVQAILNSTSSFINHSKFEMRLYGSRLDDNAKGGDIDLLLILEDNLVDDIKWVKHMLLVELKNAIGDQRIDLTITSQERIQASAFLSMIYPQSQLLSAK